MFTQHLGDGEHHIGGRHPGRAFAGEFEPDHPRDQHRHRLTQHGGLGLDTAHPPAQHAEPVFHRGVAVGAHAGVRVGHPVAFHHHAGQVLDVDLVHDAGARGYHLEVVERALTPAQELIALAVALVLDLHIALERVRGAEQIGDHRMIDHQIRRGQRVDLVRIPTQRGDRLPHSRQIHDAGHPGEVLHDHPRRGELNLHTRISRGVPVRDGLDVIAGDIGAVLGAQQILGQHLQAVRQLLRPSHRIQTVHLIRLVAHLQRVAGTERIHRIFAAHINSRLV